MEVGVVETARRFDVEEPAPVPAFLDVAGVDRVEGPSQDTLDVLYFDTVALDLAARGMTLGHSTGGSDPGWQLKVPGGPGRKRELHAWRGLEDTVPAKLLDELRVHLRGHELVPVARITTLRSRLKLYAPDGTYLAGFADGTVSARTLYPVQSTDHWREWEVDPQQGGTDFLTGVEAVLAKAGARPSEHTPKLARAFGPSWPSARVPSTVIPRAEGPASDVVVSYLGEQIDLLIRLDPDVRGEVADALHQFRAATRRIRSVLETYRTLFDKGTIGSLASDLRWLARLLGRARDAEVLRDRIREAPVLRPRGLHGKSALQPVEKDLNASYDLGFGRALRALDSVRYYRMLDRLESFHENPSVTARASRPALEMTARIVNKAVNQLHVDHKAVRRSVLPKARSKALHRVRKDAKRLRHAAEAVASVHGGQAIRLVQAAETIQKILGEHQDSVMAQAVLRQRISERGLPKSTKRAYKKAIATEEHRAAAAEAKYKRVRKTPDGARLRTQDGC
ncbi:CYTH and CHAD domain-containing protein [Arthrobacter bambusae]|uniref:CYTH and CHAD domain-containing protein n=1 Tax=Arthrobacter bambusae TaxID=1338426 RepID=UPI002788DF1D|nr:CYTH and CHAD domain-containing protein [Arthrobacter bambusae]MDQ0028692.1 CHAD domain-containing protein [Arthrobacter bambusae]MDQ0096514.1 CHAD domain-containing protein [Arthrobacter bambusae]